jgi:polysaccharide deacetylase 2 family uncharacterized protein YibQ
MSGGFGMGLFKGTLFSLIGLSALSLVSPLTPPDPGKASQVDLTTPTGSGFNAERKDLNPVLPDTDQSVVKETLSQPVPEATPENPDTDTTTAEQPQNQDGVELGSVETGEAGANVATSEGDAPPVNSPPVLGLPMPEIDQPVREIPVNRLPVVDPPATEIKAPPAIDGAQSSAADAPNTAPKAALLRNKTVFENPSGKPLMAIILLDAGADGLDKEGLLTFSFPVTFALDPEVATATADAKIYARKGFEVLAMAPTGAQALEAAENDADIAAALSGIFAKIPQAVGLVDRPAAALQQSPKLAEQVIASFQESGHGLLTYDIGLNSTDQKAQSAGVYADTVFRVLDSEGENSTVIKRYLDRAVVEAGKTGSVIIVGRTYPETVTALFSWALSSKSATVTLAPVSAVLLGE